MVNYKNALQPTIRVLRRRVQDIPFCGGYRGATITLVSDDAMKKMGWQQYAGVVCPTSWIKI